MLGYNDTIVIKRKNPVDWVEVTIYDNIDAEVQINNKWNDWWDNSNNSEQADYFVFIKKEYKDLKIWDIISFVDDFGDNVMMSITSRDFINFSNYEPFIEILCKKL